MRITLAAFESHLPRLGAWGMALAVIVALVALATEDRSVPPAGAHPVPIIPPVHQNGCLTMPDGRFVCDDGEN